jgi:prepilin peptidase CpaA
LTYVEPNTVQWGAVLGASLAAAVIDLRTRRIPNCLTLPLAAAGVFFAGLSAGWAGAGDSLAAFFVLLLPYFILFALKGSGAGDAKMMGAVGAWLGLKAGVVALAMVAISGGVFALFAMIVSRNRVLLLRNMAASLYVTMISLCSGRKGWALLQSEPQDAGDRQGERLVVPYGPAIFAGVCIGAWVVHSWI